jgi:hypothetical protein
MVIEMPTDFELTKDQVWAVHLIGGVFGGLRDDQYVEFLKAGELDRFLNGEGGAFGTAIADGGPGSKFPSAGAKNPLDVLRGLFGGLASGLGEVDQAHGVDPATERGDDIHVIHHHESGTMGAIIHYADGRTEMWGINDDGRYESMVRDGNTLTDTLISPGASTGQCIVERWTYVGGVLTAHDITKYGPFGDRSPGEGGGDENTDRNPLSGFGAAGPFSMQQVMEQMAHPEKGADELDQNTGKDPFRVSKEDQEQLGRTAPALETLDPNSGIDPVTSLNPDPDKMGSEGDTDDRLDPNTGQKPIRGGG